MIVKKIRSYLKGKVLEIDSDLKEIQDPIGDNELSSTEVKNGFKLVISNSVFERGANSFLDQFEAQLFIYKQNFNTKTLIDDFDSLFEKALSIRDISINPQNIPLDFTDIIGANINLTESEDSERLLIAETVFTVRHDFTTH